MNFMFQFQNNPYGNKYIQILSYVSLGNDDSKYLKIKKPKKKQLSINLITSHYFIILMKLKAIPYFEGMIFRGKLASTFMRSDQKI